MRLALGAVVLAAAVLVASACGGSQTASSSRLILRGTVQCTATLTTPVQVGDELGVTFRFHNVSKRTVKVYLGVFGGYWVVVRSPDGTTYDTRVPLGNMHLPPPIKTPIPPGAIRHPGGSASSPLFSTGSRSASPAETRSTSTRSSCC
jgi:hypothetical protein